MDLIDRQAAIDTLATGEELLNRVLDDMDVVGNEREKYEWGLGLIESYIDDMKELPSAQQWIPCSERLPEKDGYYLTTTCYRQVYDDFWNEDHFDRTEAVIAWMPLPAPWKGESDG